MRSAGTTTAIAATMGLRTRMLYGQSSPSPDPNIYNAAISAHAIASGHSAYGGSSANDWYTVQNTLTACLNEWQSNSRDSGVQAAVASVSPSSISTSRLDQQSIVRNVQLYQPQFQLVDLQRAFTALDNNASLVPTVLSTLQSSGMSHYLLSMANEAGRIGAYLDAGGVITSIHPRMGMAPNRLPPGKQPPENGGGGYSCAADGGLMLLAGTAFLVIGFMTLGTAPILAGAAWAGISFWGGAGVGGWALRHYTVGGCGLG